MVTKWIRSGLGHAAMLAIALVMASGCATQGFVQSEIAKANGYTDERVGEVRGDVDRVRGDVSEVGSRTDRAMQKASLAERLASGEIQYSEISTHRDDATRQRPPTQNHDLLFCLVFSIECGQQLGRDGI